MTRWHERFEAHSVTITIKSLVVELSSIDTSNLSLEFISEISRLHKVLEYIKNILNSSDPDFVQLQTLDTLNQNLSFCKDQIKIFAESKNLANLVEANNSLDSALQVVSRIPIAYSPIDKSSVLKAAKAYSDTYEKHLASFSKTVSVELDRLRSLVTTIESDSNTNSEKLSELKKNLVSVESSIQIQLAEFNKQFSNSEIDRTARFELTLEKLNSKLDDEFKNFVIKTQEALSILAKFIDDGKKIFGVVVNTLQAGAYSSYANDQKNSANLFRLCALLAMFFAVAILIAPEIYEYFYRDGDYILDWTKLLTRMPVTLVLFIPAFYLTRESSRHRNTEIINRRRELILTTIDPYIALLEKEKADQIKSDIAKTLFSDGIAKEENESADPVSLIEAITKFSKQIMNR